MIINYSIFNTEEYWIHFNKCYMLHPACSKSNDHMLLMNNIYKYYKHLFRNNEYMLFIQDYSWLKYD